MQSAEKPPFIALYLDEDITYRLAEALREHGFDALAAYEVGNSEVPDQVHLEFATRQGRALVTCNAKDFSPLFDEWWETGRQHHGVIVSEQLAFGEMLRRLLDLLHQVTAEEMRNSYRNLAEFAESGR